MANHISNAFAVVLGTVAPKPVLLNTVRVGENLYWLCGGCDKVSPHGEWYKGLMTL
jgi:hypothetical protein